MAAAHRKSPKWKTVIHEKSFRAQSLTQCRSFYKLTAPPLSCTQRTWCSCGISQGRLQEVISPCESYIFFFLSFSYICLFMPAILPLTSLISYCFQPPSSSVLVVFLPQDRQGVHVEAEPLCVLDFYIAENLQRHGYGLELFDFVLQVKHSSVGGRLLRLDPVYWRVLFQSALQAAWFNNMKQPEDRIARQDKCCDETLT